MCLSVRTKTLTFLTVKPRRLSSQHFLFLPIFFFPITLVMNVHEVQRKKERKKKKENERKKEHGFGPKIGLHAFFMYRNNWHNFICKKNLL